LTANIVVNVDRYTASVARSTFTAGVAAANVNCGWVGEGE
jgi:hypothetical protein